MVIKWKPADWVHSRLALVQLAYIRWPPPKEEEALSARVNWFDAPKPFYFSLDEGRFENSDVERISSIKLSSRDIQEGETQAISPQVSTNISSFHPELEVFALAFFLPLEFRKVSTVK